MWQSKGYVPGVVNVRVTFVLLLTPGMLAGAPAGSSSKKTLCPTLPNANVTVPPCTRWISTGVNARAGVAFTVADSTSGGGLGGGDCVAVELAPPHATAAMVASIVRKAAIRTAALCAT